MWNGSKNLASALAFIWMVLLLAPAALAQRPVATLFSVFPPGGQAGSTFEVSLTGENLDDLMDLHFSHPGIKATPIPAESQAELNGDVPVRFEVTIDADVPLGQHEARAIGKYGISNPRAFQIGRLPEVTIKEPSITGSTEEARTVAIGTVINGRTTKEKIDCYQFSAVAGQRLLVEAFGRRIDSRADLTLVITDTAGEELARCNDFYSRDPFIDFTVPKDGTYQLQVYDFLFQGGNDFFYRISLSSGPKIDFVFPPSGLAGTKGTFTIYGRNLPGGLPAGALKLDGSELEQLDVEVELPAEITADGRLPSAHPSEARLDAVRYSVESADGESASFPIYFAGEPVIKEIEPNNTGDTSQAITPPCEIVGQFNPARDQDWYTFQAKKGEVYFLEVISRRMQWSTDPILRVQRVATVNGKQQLIDIVELDDLPPDPRHPIRPTFETTSSDPALRLAIPQDGEYRVLVRDVFASSRGSPLDLYRLIIRKAAPDFRLIAVTELPITDEAVPANRGKLYSYSLAPGGTLGVNIVVSRIDDFNGEVTVEAVDLPEGVTAIPTIIGPGATKGTLVLSAAADAPRFNGVIRIMGRATMNDQPIEREAVGAALVWPIVNFQTDLTQFRLTGNIALAVNPLETEMVSFANEADDDSPQLFEVVQGEKLEIPVRMKRPQQLKDKLKVVVLNLPKHFRADPLDMEDSEGVLRLSVAKPALPGAYTIVLSSNVRIDYTHNPEIAEAAAKRAKELAAAAETAKAEFNKLTEAKNAARKQVDKLKRDVDAAKKSHEKALEAVRAAKSEFQSAKENHQKASDQLRKEPDDEKLKKTVSDKKANLEKKSHSLAEAEKNSLAAQQAVKDIAAKADAARVALAQADKAAADADRKSKAAAQESNQALQRATRLANVAKPKSVYVPFFSRPITVKVIPPPAPEGSKS